MDRSLWLLTLLRTKGTLRRWKKTFTRPKGIILGVFTALLLSSWLFSIGATMRLGIHPPLEQIRRFAPLGLFAFTILSLFTSAGEQALYFSPAEVAFLFAGPYRKRQLIGYKLFVTLALCGVSSLFFALGGRMMSPNAASAFVGSLLLILFFQLSQMVLGLAASTAGAMAWSRSRKILLAALFVLAGAALASAGWSMGGAPSFEALERVERSPILAVALAPFRWFVMTFTAEKAADLALYGSLCLMVDAALVAAIFALDASYLEAASSASARRFARMRRMMSGGGGVRPGTRTMGRFRFRPPSVPWWGGVGPNFWRQMTVALGDPKRLLGLLAMLAFMPIIFGAIGTREPKSAGVLLYVSLGTILWMSISLSVILPFDFRGDIDVMEELKTLPIAPTRLALGQILTPTLVASLAQAVAMTGAIAALGAPDPAIWSCLAFLLPVNLTFFAVENLLFLWYPSRVVAGQFDIMAIGRQILLLLGKVIGLGLGIGLAALAGGLAYFLTRGLGPTLVVGWAVMMASGLALVPLVGLAFARFDVSRDIPA